MNTALCGFVWHIVKHTLSLSYFLVIPSPGAMPGASLAMRQSGAWQFGVHGGNPCFLHLLPLPCSMTPVNIEPAAPVPLFHWVPSVCSEAGCSRWHDDVFSPCSQLLQCWALLCVHCACCHRCGAGEGGENISGEEPLPPSCPFSCAVFALYNRKGACGMRVAARILDLLSVCQPKTSAMLSALSDMVLQASCGRDVVWLRVWRGPHLDYISGVMLTSHPLPGIYQGSWRGVTDLGWHSPAALLHPPWQLPPLCPDRDLSVFSTEKHPCQCATFLFTQFNELMTPNRDAAVVIGTFCGGTCSFWYHIDMNSSAYCSIRHIAFSSFSSKTQEALQ